MTREEIKNTPELVDFMLDKSVIADSREKLRKRLEGVCNLAIKALEQEPCDDAVSRQVVKEQMLKYGFHAPDMTVTEFVEDLPPVLPKHEGNTVSEEVYTEEYIQRQKLEYELYVLKKKISELI